MSRAFKTVVILFTIIFVVFSAMFGVLATKVITDQSLGDEIYIQSLENESRAGIINMLLIGVDDGGSRSDTIMLVSIDGYSNRVSILSIPRDTRVKAEGYTVQKINALIGFGQEEVKNGQSDEPEEILIDMVKEMTGLPIHYFMTVDFNGFKDIVEAVDGVDFNVPYNMDYDDPAQNLHIHLKAGQQHLDGQGAHDFVRYRHDNNGYAPGEYVMGDEGRQYWQQEFMKELLKQKCSPQYISKIDDIFDVVKENVRTNYTVKDLINHLYLVKEINIDEIGSYQLPGKSEYIGGVWWYIQDEEMTDELIKEVFLPMSESEWKQYKEENSDYLSKFQVLDETEKQSAQGQVKSNNTDDDSNDSDSDNEINRGNSKNSVTTIDDE